MTKILVLVECLVECLVEWAAWAAWVEWVCKPVHFTKNYKKPSFYWAFFLPQHFIRARRKHEKSTKKKSSNESII
jgi:hypothetical protein